MFSRAPHVNGALIPLVPWSCVLTVHVFDCMPPAPTRLPTASRADASIAQRRSLELLPLERLGLVRLEEAGDRLGRHLGRRAHVVAALVG